ncbi:MAG TPA: DUF4097 family beta strand repeat-containing protein [Gemmataceae bacterium]|jgi:DUF4097 and DUF4098 domain-containing protein YvlB|nr:DUF4097 family beta strand repeat-containing protein [Gemmataceae bacterium]
MNQFARWLGSVVALLLLVVQLGCGRNSSTPNMEMQQFSVQMAQPKETIDENVKQSFQASAKPTILVDTFVGAITFEPSEGNSVQVEVLKQGWGETKEEAADNLKKIDLVLKQEGDTIRVIATRPEQTTTKTIKQQNSVQVITQLANPGKADVRIKGPAQAVLDFKTNFGNIAATGAANSLKARAGSGSIALKQNAAAFDLTSNYGTIAVDGPGAGHAKTSSGGIDIRGSRKPIVLESGYGAIDVTDASGVTAKTNSGNITVKASKGPVQLQSGYGVIQLKDANGATKVETTSGDIHVTGAQGEYSAKSGYGGIKIDVKDSPVQAETNSGSIDIRGCRGAVKAQSGYGTVDVHGDDALVQLRSNSGSVHFAGSLAAGQSNITSGYGELAVKLPADAQFKVQAKTGYGNIRTQFDMKKTKDSDKELVGTVGADPKAVLHIESNSGSVQIDKR